MLEHLEAFLGKIDFGWSSKDSKNGIQIVKFKNQPFQDIDTFSTLGLSNYVLKSSSGKEIRQELIVSVYNNFDETKIASSLLTFSEHVLDTGKALLRGEVIGPGTPFISKVNTVGLYSSIPVFYDDGLHVNKKITPPVVVVWLIPLVKEEIDYVAKFGWENFEDALEKKECEFWDLNRDSCVS